MPVARVRKFEMDRRQMLKATGIYGVGATMLTPALLHAKDQDVCNEIDSGIFEDENIKTGGARLYYWIDGMHLGSNDKDAQDFPAEKTRLPSRANVTLFMPLTQTGYRYVERVVLVERGGRTLGARYFDASMKMSNGCVPYVTFENITLDHTKSYDVIYTVKETNSVTLYQSAIEKPVLSRLTEEFLPPQLRTDIRNFLKGTQKIENKEPGLITTQYQYYTENSLRAHTARGRVTHIGTDGSFNVDIDFMHNDTPYENHYMRNFIVMDPVGLVLGMVRRENKDDEANGKVFQPADSSEKAVHVSEFTAEERVSFGVDKVLGDLKPANINDCPYIQIYSEDVLDAIARTIIRLR